METINSPADLRPGDIMLGPIGGLVGLGVGLGQLLLGEGFRVGTLSIRHVGIVVHDAEMDGRPWLAQAMPGGAEVVQLRTEEHWTEHHAYVRLPEDYPGQAEDAAAVARLMVRQGVSYSWASYLSLAAWRFGIRPQRLLDWINRRREPDGLGYVSHRSGVRLAPWLPVEAICSVFADQAWTLVGKKVLEGVRPQAVTPGALADTLLSFPGAVWCRPRPDGTARSWVENYSR